MMFRCGRGTLSRPTCSLVLVFALVAILSSGFEINETQEVASLMDQLFYEGDTCNTPALELGFAVEASQDGTPEDRETAFTNAMEFVKTMARAMNVSDSGTHVGLIVYGKKPSMPFDFNEYFDMPSLSDAIDQVKQPKDGHMTGHALSYVKKQLYDKSARPGIPKALIVVLSKKSGDLVVQGAQALKSSGVKIYTVGIGPESDPLEMNDLASDIKDTFVTDDAHLPSLVKKLVPKICSESKDTSPAEELEMTSDGEHESTMSPDQEPGPQESRPLTAVTHLPTEPVGMVKPASKTGTRANKVDLVFLVASTGKMGLANWKRTLLFMKYVANAFEISKRGSRVGVVVEGRTFHVALDFKRMTKKSLLMAVMGLIPLPFGDQKIGKGLEDVRDLVLKPSGRNNIPDIVIVLTDGKSSDDVSKPVKALIKAGVEIFAVGLGDRVSSDQLESIASFPYSTHSYHGEFNKVVKVASKVIAEIYKRHFCGGLNTLLKQLLLRKMPRRKKISDQDDPCSA